MLRAALVLLLVTGAVSAQTQSSTGTPQTGSLSAGRAASPSSTGPVPAAHPALSGESARSDVNLPRVLLVAQKETTVVAQFVGQIRRLGGDLGASIAQGAPLVVFDCQELEARTKMSEAEVNASRQQFETKQRLKELGGIGDVEVQLAQANLEKSKAQLEVSRAQMRQCVASAPFSGRIVKLHVKPYQSVTIGQPLVDLVSSGALKVRLNAPSRWLAWLKRGVSFEVKVDETGRSYPAVVSAINGRVDAVSQSVEIEGQLGGVWPELLAGMSGNARFTVPVNDAR
jgi:membrane fusion protein, multidrug efflux system